MRRLRFFRVLFPVLLLPFLILLALQLQPKTPIHNPNPNDTSPGSRVEGVNWSDYTGGRLSYSAVVSLIQQQAEERFHLEGIERLQVEREDAPPLIISAELAGVDGAAGQRLIRLQGEVEAREEEEALRVSLPELLIDQGAGEARSIGSVSLQSPSYRGEAESVVYGLEGQPTRMFAVRVESDDGATLEALHLRLNKRTKDFELQGDVRLARGAEFLVAERMRVWRRPEGRLQRIVAKQGVSGAADSGSGTLIHFRADRIQANWDEAGEAENLLLTGEALLVQGTSTLAASRIEATRVPEGGNRWDVRATGAVYAEGFFGNDRAVLRAEALRATLEPGGELVRGQASGSVSFRGSDTSGEAEEAVFTPRAPENEIVLTAAPRRRARLARADTRIAADRIITDRLGARLTAQGKVEATLLPAEESKTGSATTGLFQVDQAVHFVASRLVSERSGSELTFSGAVRGWQGDRTLSADRVFLDQRNHSMRATGHVNTRIPREEAVVTVSQADYLQISAEQLEYSEQEARAVYTGNSRIRQAEGWMEAGRVVIDLTGQAGGIREIHAFEKVRFEYRAPGDEGLPRPVAGEGDRLVYVPADQNVLLYGDETPASVRRGAEGGGTTTGRVLRYRLDVGTLKVESGDQDRVRIRTPGGSL